MYVKFLSFFFPKSNCNLCTRSEGSGKKCSIDSEKAETLHFAKASLEIQPLSNLIIRMGR